MFKLLCNFTIAMLVCILVAKMSINYAEKLLNNGICLKDFDLKSIVIEYFSK